MLYMPVIDHGTVNTKLDYSPGFVVFPCCLLPFLVLNQSQVWGDSIPPNLTTLAIPCKGPRFRVQATAIPPSILLRVKACVTMGKDCNTRYFSCLEL